MWLKTLCNISYCTVKSVDAEKIAISVHVSFQYSNWILPKFYFSTYWILLRVCIQYAELMWSCEPVQNVGNTRNALGPRDCDLTGTFWKSFKNFPHFEGFLYFTKYLLQNHFHKYGIKLISSANPLKFWLMLVRMEKALKKK